MPHVFHGRAKERRQPSSINHLMAELPNIPRIVVGVFSRTVQEATQELLKAEGPRPRSAAAEPVHYRQDRWVVHQPYSTNPCGCTQFLSTGTTGTTGAVSLTSHNGIPTRAKSTHCLFFPNAEIRVRPNVGNRPFRPRLHGMVVCARPPSVAVSGWSLAIG